MYNAKVIPEKGMLSAVEAHLLINDLVGSVALNRNDVKKSENFLDQVESIVKRFRAYQYVADEAADDLDPTIDPWANDDGPIGVGTFIPGEEIGYHRRMSALEAFGKDPSVM